MKLIEEMFDRITGSEKPYFKAFYKRIYAYLKLYLSSMAICLVVEMAFCRVMALYTTHSDKWNGRKYSLVISSVLWITVGLLCSAIIPMYSVTKLIKAIFERVNGYEKTYVEAVYNRIENYVEVYLTAMSDFLVVEMAFCRVMALYTRDCDKWRGRKYTLVISTILWIFVGITCGPIIPMTVLIPCCLNLIFFIMILWQLKKFEAHRRKTIKSMKSSIDNSSRMLQAILIMFLFVKTPQALLLIFNSLFMIDYYILIAPITTQFVEVLDVANSSTSFIFYCTMSSHFREVFVRLFVPEIVQRRMKSTETMMHVTVVASTKNLRVAWQ
ncbi:hypothetical protein GCK72_018003 [Caenorhabditis remanei]|uniref:G-protein coupled receptors family 1 profile domain-containing protein n=1 Tax=Caenorhabditis remanei TaxID=31234 RepID=A0A6A5GAE2_CAERE|nr:hypothetical protein GCK72_018003 [Caenorhabditis remanei]KAF1751449.1 hypothetical protein GCK72_018003 [Caenorhabditis remanei]